MEYRGKSKVLKALSLGSGGGEGYTQYALSRVAGDVETWTSGVVTVRKLMIGVVSVTVASSNLSTSQTTILTIPSKYRPKSDIYLTGEAYDASPRGIGIKTNGQIVAYAGGTGMYATVTYLVPVEWDYEIVSYYRDATEDAIRHINALGSGWESFVIITDTHGADNAQHSQNIVRKIVEETGIKAFWLGDVNAKLWANNDQSYAGQEYNTFAEPLRPISNKLYFILGNHERVAWDALDYDDIEVINDDFVASKDVTGVTNRYYYYFDDADRKMRYLCLNTCENTSNWHKMSSEQISWIATAVSLPSSDWSLVVLGHLDIDPDTFLYDGSEDSTAIISALESCNGHIVGYFCGHQHLDLISEIDNRFHQVTLLCDRIDNRIFYPDYETPARVEGTESEQAVTIVHVNPTDKRVEFTRIGAKVEGQLYGFDYT